MCHCAVLRVGADAYAWRTHMQQGLVLCAGVSANVAQRQGQQQVWGRGWVLYVG
jgi:hypothetical protein